MADAVTRGPRDPGPLTVAVAWAGGAAFALSLALFVYAYAIPFGVVVHGAWRTPVIIDVLLFSAFGLHHSILARSGAKRAVVAVVPVWLERSLFTWIASLLLIVVLVLWRPVPGDVWQFGSGWRWLGYGIQMAGVVLTALASSAIDVLDLAGVRPVLDARRHAPPRHVPLETGGVYGLVRHPVYLAWVLMVFGTPHLTGTRAVFAVVSTLYLAIAIPFEERSLVGVFGDAYRAYQRQTPSRLIPGLW